MSNKTGKKNNTQPNQKQENQYTRSPRENKGQSAARTIPHELKLSDEDIQAVANKVMQVLQGTMIKEIEDRMSSVNALVELMKKESSQETKSRNNELAAEEVHKKQTEDIIDAVKKQLEGLAGKLDKLDKLDKLNNLEKELTELKGEVDQQQTKSESEKNDLKSQIFLEMKKASEEASKKVSNEISKWRTETERLQADNEKLRGTIKNNEQSNERLIIQKNTRIDKLSEEKEKLEEKTKNLEEKLKSTEKDAERKKNALQGTSASIISAIQDHFTELELRISKASQRSTPLKSDMNAIMKEFCRLRNSLEEIELDNGDKVGFKACVNESDWLERTPIPFDDKCHDGGKPGQQVIVCSRGYRYKDNLGIERIIKAKVSPVVSAEEDQEKKSACEVKRSE